LALTPEKGEPLLAGGKGQDAGALLQEKKF